MRINKTVALEMMIIYGSLVLPACADDVRTSINWCQLNLSPQQLSQIHTLEDQWNRDYLQLQPTIVDDQRKLTRLLSDPTSDPIEIMALQQSIARRKEQLRSSATTNYLRKRQVLNQDQQHQLEVMIRQVVSERQRLLTGQQSDVMPDRVQSLIERVRNIWPGQGDP